VESKGTLSLSVAGAVHLQCVHVVHNLALVGEDPGKRGDERLPLYPYPRFSTGGRLCEMSGLSRQKYLETFARADLIPHYPGPSFPAVTAKLGAPLLAQRLAPRPLILLGRAVSQAFCFPTQNICTWADYMLGAVLIRAAVIPHPSGRNPWYRYPENKQKVADWLRQEILTHTLK
jgi:hypothetical protein